jgi:Carboxypeptidase regulatory-like domain
VTSTDAGAFELRRELDAPAGTLLLQATHPEFDDGQAAAAWGRSDVRIVLPVRVPVRVRVVDASGNPFAVDAVEQWHGSERTRFAKDGDEWRGGVCRGANEIRVVLRDEQRAAGWSDPSPPRVRVRGDTPVECTFVARRPASCAVRIEDDGGDPVPGASVQLVDGRGEPVGPDCLASPPSEDWMQADAIEIQEVATDARGRCELRGPSDTQLAIVVRARHFEHAVVQPFRMDDEATTVRLVRLVSVRGRVLAPPGESAAGWRLNLRRPNLDPGTTTKVAADGSFALDDVATGRWIVQVRSENFLAGKAGEVVLRAADNPEVTIDLRDRLRCPVRGSVAVDGTPLRHTQVIFERIETPASAWCLESAGLATTDGDGQFTGSLRPGRYQLRLPMDEHGLWWMHGPEVEVGPDGAADLRCEVHTGQLELQVLDQRGAPARGFALQLLQGAVDEVQSGVWSDGDGVIRQRLAVGECRPAWIGKMDSGPNFYQHYVAARHALDPIAIRAGETGGDRRVARRSVRDPVDGEAQLARAPRAASTLRSCSSSHCLAGRPPPNPQSPPSLPITRWHGTTIEIGLRPLAAPTARIALGLPRRTACCW